MPFSVPGPSAVTGGRFDRRLARALANHPVWPRQTRRALRLLAAWGSEEAGPKRKRGPRPASLAEEHIRNWIWTSSEASLAQRCICVGVGGISQRGEGSDGGGAVSLTAQGGHESADRSTKSPLPSRPVAAAQQSLQASGADLANGAADADGRASTT